MSGRPGMVRSFLIRRVLLPAAKRLLDARPIDDRRGWWKVLETYTGAWQQQVEVDYSTTDAYWANFACLTLIAGDIAKMPLRVMDWNATDKIWVPGNKRGGLLRRPNRYQTTLEFVFSWIMSELRTGNTYVLKQRDPTTGFVTALYVLDPCHVTPLITTDGGVYYRLQVDNLAGLPNPEGLYVPASEIIHDRMYPLYHPLVGLPPVFACGMAAMQGAAIVNTSAGFFTNRGLPAGILSAPGHIPDDTAQRMKEYFNENFTGQNAGKVAVLGDGLKFESLGTSAVDAQLIEQLKMTGVMICACYHVPGYKIGVGDMPTVNNTASLNQQYYDQCLQYIVEKFEQRLDEGLELRETEESRFDIEALLRMDPQTRSTVIGDKVKGGILSIDEARRDDNRPPVPGGAVPYLQQQNYNLSDLERRSERDRNKPDDVQAQAMNGAQVQSLQGILTAVATNQMPPDAGKASIAAAFPLLTQAQIDAMIDPLRSFTPAPAPNAKPAAATPEPEDEEVDEDEEMDEDEVKQFRSRILEAV